MASEGLRLSGPYFEFLVTNKDEYIEYRGTARTRAGLKQEYFHHPEALRVSDGVVSLFADCFRSAGPQFQFFRYTEYDGDALHKLAACLETRRTTVKSLDENGIALLVHGSLLAANLEADGITPAWEELREVLADNLSGILAFVHQASQEGKTLLVLGV